MLGALLLLSSPGILFSLPQPAYAEGSTVVGKLQGSGLVFKDTLLIQRFEGAYFVGEPILRTCDVTLIHCL